MYVFYIHEMHNNLKNATEYHMEIRVFNPECPYFKSIKYAYSESYDVRYNHEPVIETNIYSDNDSLYMYITDSLAWCVDFIGIELCHYIDVSKLSAEDNAVFDKLKLQAAYYIA